MAIFENLSRDAVEHFCREEISFYVPEDQLGLGEICLQRGDDVLRNENDGIGYKVIGFVRKRIVSEPKKIVSEPKKIESRVKMIVSVSQKIVFIVKKIIPSRRRSFPSLKGSFGDAGPQLVEYMATEGCRK